MPGNRVIQKPNLVVNQTGRGWKIWHSWKLRCIRRISKDKTVGTKFLKSGKCATVHFGSAGDIRGRPEVEVEEGNEFWMFAEIFADLFHFLVPF
jgi:hypothetical protein